MTSLLQTARAWKPRLTVRHIVLILLSILLIATAIRSLEWRPGVDIPWMLFDARMIDQHGLLPYRDIFDVNMVGTFYLHLLIGRLTGYTDGLALRWFDLAYLAAISAITWAWLRQVDHTVGWAAAVLFGLCYLSFGPFVSILEREYLMLLPLTAAVLVATGLPRLDDRLRCFIVGLLFGLIATVKPHAAIGFLPVSVFLWADIRERRSGLGRAQIASLAGLAAAGAAIPVAALAVYLVATGTLGPYLDILRNYVTLYARFTTTLTIVTGPERTAYVVNSLVSLGKHHLWLAPAAVGMLSAFTIGQVDRRGRRLIVLALALGFSYIVYLFVAGQYHPNHWLLMLYFLVVLASLCFLPVRDARAGWFLRAFPAGILIVTLLLKRDVAPALVTEWVDRYVNGKMPPPPSEGRPDAIATYLRANLRPGDRVQPLDWAHGILHAMLLTNTPPATRFTVDMLFLHDTDTPYIQGLQREFITSLEAQPPRFVIYVPGYRFADNPHVSQSFPALQALLDEQYSMAFIGRGYRIYERGSPARRGLILYPQAWPPRSNGYLEAPAQGVIGLTEKQIEDAQAVEGLLAEFAAGRDRLTFELMRPDVDPGPIEAWLRSHAFKLSDLTIDDAQVVEYLGPDVCGESQSQEVMFGDAIRLNSAAARVVEIDGQKYLCARLDWEAVETVDRSYQVGVYLIDASGQLAAQHDGRPADGASPTDSWQPGQPVPDLFAMTLPDDLPPGAYMIQVALYDLTSGARLPLAGGAGQNDTLTIGQASIP